MQELIMLIKFYLKAKKVTRIVPKHTYRCNEYFACTRCGWRAETRRNHKRLYAKCSMCDLEVRIPK